MPNCTVCKKIIITNYYECDNDCGFIACSDKCLKINTNHPEKCGN